jgi:hypothetical protein
VSEEVCFHGPTLVLAVPKVLIERNHSAIDRSDDGRTGGCTRTGGTSLSPVLGERRREPDSARGRCQRSVCAV